MESKDVYVLENIIESCNEILEAVERRGSKKLEDLENDKELQFICAFQIIQIGEQVNSLSVKFVNSHPEIPWRNIVGMRNILTHNYGKVNAVTLWETVAENISPLKEFCEKIIRG